MRYYPDKSVSIRLFKSKLSSYMCTVKKESMMLTLHGIYKYNKEDLAVYKLCLKGEDQKIKNYIETHDFFISADKWKKTSNSHQLPFIHKIISVKSYIFSPRPRANLKLIVEETDGKISDYYFITKEDSDNFSIKEDIGSFLRLLK